MINRMKINPAQIKSNLDDLARAALCSALKLLLAETEKKLFIRAEHSNDLAQKNQILDQIHHLKRTSEQFERAFITQTTEPNETPPKDWYKLYKNRTLAIQIEDMISHARAKFGIELAQYESRIKFLNKNHPDIIPDHLYTLPGIVAAYLTQIHIFDAAIQENLVLALGHQFLNKLEPMYILMNDLLIQNGALPEIKSARKEATSALDDLLDEMALSEANLSEVLLQAQLVPKGDLLQKLLDMMAGGELILPKKAVWNTQQFYENLIKRLTQKSHPAELAPKDTEAVMLTGTILSGIMNDRLINPVIKNPITQLQLAVLYTALSDDGFFSLAKHPARVVLNKLALIGSDPAQNASTLQKIPPLIDEFLSTQAKHPPIDFSSLLQAVTAMDQGEFHGTPVSEQSPSTAPKILIARSQQRVADMVRLEIKGRTLHPITQQFIEQMLAPFLVHMLMSHGRQCSEWAQGFNLLQELATLDTQTVSAKRLLATIGHIHELIDHPFFHADEVSPDLFGNITTQLIAHINELRDQQIAQTPQAPQFVAPEPQTRGEPLSPAPSQSSPAEPDATITLLEQKPIEPAAKPIEASTQSEPAVAPIKQEEPARFTLGMMQDQRIKLFMQRFVLNGEWLQIFTAEGAALRRLKANQINTELGTINFSNRNGEIALVLPLVQFFDDLVQGRSHPVFDNAAFSKALAQLAETLAAEHAR
ncbi:DUF1631 family protein [Halothiobacillus sp. DCM-1]|uniref:DUF1631 family protein n=1 Tax=Halothiobacillus sp. DCM-1 TaxID=3112558 RepID=UPI00324AFE8D